MKAHLFGTLLLLGLVAGAPAQSTEKLVEKIQKVYADVSEKARLAATDDEQGQFGGLFVNELTINSRNHQWRAVGIYNHNYKFFYRSLDTEDHMYPDQLVFVVNERKISDRSYREEWLFSETGTLMFYFYKPEGDPEVRIYFSGIKPIRIVEGAKTRDRLSADDLKTVNKMVAHSRKVQHLFKLSLGI